MADKTVREHLRKALDALVDAEKSRVETILENADKSIAESIKKMKPLIQILKELKEEVGEVEGLNINPAEKGHMATVESRTSVSTDSYSISTSVDNTAFKIKKFISFSMDDSYSEVEEQVSTVEEVMEKVIRLVGEHIGSQRAHQDYFNYPQQ